MNKTIIIKILEHLKKNVKELRWIDVEAGQLTAAERPPIAYPACLVDMAYTQCEALSGHRQKVTVQIQLQIVFQHQGATSSATPTAFRDKALAYYDVTEKIHEALQYWTSEGLWMPLKRVSIRPRTRKEGLKVFEAIYQLTYIDTLGTQRYEG